jgi:hypothetical protein
MSKHSCCSQLQHAAVRQRSAGSQEYSLAAGVAGGSAIKNAETAFGSITKKI